MNAQNDQITAWKERIAIIAKNILDFDTQVRAKVNEAWYSGETKTKVEKAISIWNCLVAEFPRITEIVDRAVELANKKQIFYNNTDEVKKLLEDKVIVVKGEAIPTMKRGLLEKPNQEVELTLEEMLARIVEEYDAVRAIFSEIKETADKNNARLAAVRQQLDALKRIEAELGVKTGMPSAEIHAKEDPLGCSKEILLLEAQLEDYKDRLYKLNAERIEIRKFVDDIKSLLAKLEDLTEKSRKVKEDVQRRISRSSSLVEPMSVEAESSLRVWLNTLEENIGLGRLVAAKVGLEKLKKECELHLEAEQRKYEQNKANLDEMDELKGMYQALLAKANAKKLYQSKDFQLFANDTQKVLDRNPFDLIEARQSVNQFSEKIRSLK